jgi:hypothetical protein
MLVTSPHRPYVLQQTKNRSATNPGTLLHPRRSLVWGLIEAEFEHGASNPHVNGSKFGGRNAYQP